MTEVELTQITALAKCTFSPGSTAKAFIRRLASYADVKAEDITDRIIADATRKYTDARELSDKERAFLDRLAHQYRKQLGKCMSVACIVCLPQIDPKVISVALDMIIEGRSEVDEYAKQLPAWRKTALARYNAKHNERFTYPYEYVTSCAPQSRRAETLGDIFCRFCGERLFAQVKQPHRLVKESTDAQRHLTICALQILAGLKAPAAVGHRALPMEQLWDAGPLFGGGR
jgi:hypothetical protein